MKARDAQMIYTLPKNMYLEYIKLFPVTQTEQVKKYTTLLLTLSAVIIFSLFAISPTINTIIELRRQLADSQFADNALTDKIAALQSLQQQYSTLGTAHENISMAIPTTPEVPLLLAKIQTLAQDSGVHIVKLESLQVDLNKKSKLATTPSSFVVVITVSGTYDETMKLLQSFQSFDRLLTIDAVTIERSKLGTDPLTASIRARAYFHPESI